MTSIHQFPFASANATPSPRRSPALATALLVLAALNAPHAVFAQAAMADASSPIAAAPANPHGFAPRGRLEPAGRYFVRPRGGTVVYLDKGIVFSYGLGPAVSEWKSQPAQERWLRRRVEAGGRFSDPDSGPKWYDPALRGWHRLAAPPECAHSARYLHTTTATSDGKLLVAGGLCDTPKMADDHTPHQPYAALSLWDAATHRWLPAPSLAQPRIFHSATPMPDGGVLFIGGESDPALSDAPSAPVLASVERFGAGTMSTLPALAVARAKHAATALPGKRVLVTGGFDASGQAIASAELFDADARAWRLLPPMHVARHSHTATLLDDGRVLVAGGIGADGKMLDSTEIWDPIQQSWTTGPVLPIALYGHAAAKLASGQVLVAGGGWLPVAGTPVPWAWTWNPTDEDWELAALATPANESEMSSPVTLVPQADGSALVFTSAAILRWVPAASGGQLSHERGDIISDRLASAGIKQMAKMTAAPKPQQALDMPVLVDFDDYKWLLLAIGAPIIGYALLRRVRGPRLGKASSWTLRIALYTALLLVAVPVAWTLAALRDIKPLQQGSGVLPCRIIGVWSSRHGSALRQLEFRDDGSFVQAANRAEGDPPEGYRGRWEVKGNNMIWYTDHSVVEADVNRMQVTRPGAFVLTEQNGSTTVFEQVRAVASTRCAAD